MHSWRVAVLAAALLAPAPVCHAASASSSFYCEGQYALCDRALCQPVLKPGRHHAGVFNEVVCTCAVVRGWSVGPGRCITRMPTFSNGRKFIVSTYSNRFDAQARILTCRDPETQWAKCDGAPCVVDAADPTKAVCTCPLMRGPMATRGGDCLPQSCKAIWSGATLAQAKTAGRNFYLYLKKNHPDYPVLPPAEACPAPP